MKSPVIAAALLGVVIVTLWIHISVVDPSVDLEKLMLRLDHLETVNKQYRDQLSLASKQSLTVVPPSPPAGETKPPSVETKNNKLPADLSQFSRSQGGQDKYMYEHHFYAMKEPGIFVEFGARNGEEDSNTFLLEKGLGWHGVMVEAVLNDFEQIAAKRPNCVAVNAAVCPKPGQISFVVSVTGGWHGAADSYPQNRLDKQQEKITVPCITLGDLLDQVGFGRVNYMSVDTEGSEFDIISAFDTSRYVVDFIQLEVLLTNSGEGVSPTKRYIDMMHAKGYDLEVDLHFADDTSDLIFKRTSRADMLKFASVQKNGVKVAAVKVHQ